MTFRGMQDGLNFPREVCQSVIGSVAYLDFIANVIQIGFIIQGRLLFGESYTDQ